MPSMNYVGDQEVTFKFMKDSILFDDCRKFTEIAIEKLLEVISIAVSYKLGKFKDGFTG
jgi:hypothetical protein